MISKRAEALADLGARLQAANTLAQDRELYEKRSPTAHREAETAKAHRG